MEIHYTLHTPEMPLPLHGTFFWYGVTITRDLIRPILNKEVRKKYADPMGNSYCIKLDLRKIEKVEVYHYVNGEEVAI